MNVNYIFATLVLLLIGWVILYFICEFQNTDYNKNNKWYNRISIRQIYAIINVIILVAEISYTLGTYK
jgi:heme/copper-type cytochrome/quinol oxidase subunit 2